MDAIESELRGLLDGGTFNRNKLLLMLKELQTETEKKQLRGTRTTYKVPAPPVTRYKEIKRNFICRHCGARFSSITQLLPKESIPAVNEKGESFIIDAKSPCEIDCYVGSCEHCKDFVQTLDRSELETRYIAIIHKYGIYTHQEHRPSKPMEIRL